MDLVKFVLAKPGSKAWTGPFSLAKTPSISVPYGQGMEFTMNMPVPQSGMERAEWINLHRARAIPNDAPQFCASASNRTETIGPLEREILGSTRDDYLGGMIVRSHNWFDFNDPATENSDNIGKMWKAQTTASNGLWDENDDVYTSQDSETIWA
jgi:hypothetical protein